MRYVKHNENWIAKVYRVNIAIKTILFDFGGVIYHTPSMNWMFRWKKLLHLNDQPELMEMLTNPNESNLVQDMCLGKISEDHIWDLLADKWSVKPDLIRNLQGRMSSRRNLNKPMMALMDRLNKSYQTAILSNAGDQARGLMESTFHLDQYVEEIIISAEEGVIKPDHKIYQIAMDRLKATPDTSLFIDDYLPNIEAARAFGMQAIHHTANQSTFEKVQIFLNPEV